MRKKKVYVSGMGIVSSIGQSLEAFCHALKNGYSEIKISKNYPELSFLVLQAELGNFCFHQALEKNSNVSVELKNKICTSIRRYPLIIEVGLIAALEAWFNSRLYLEKLDRNRIGIVVAGENTTQNYYYQLIKNFQTSLHYLPPTYAIHFMDTNLVGVLSEILNIQGPGCSLGAASASGNSGIIQGIEWIQHNIVDIVVIAGAMAELSPLELQGFCNIGALVNGKKFAENPLCASRPFDKGHEGFVPGQAAACVILESKNSSQKRDFKPYAEILNAVCLLDGNRLSDPKQDGEARMMRTLLEKAQIDPSQVQYINTHGTSTPVGDQIEIAAIRDVFNDSMNNIWLNSTKCLTGHCLWSAGIVELIASILQINENFIHPNINLEQPIDINCKWVGQQAQPVNIDIALSNSFGFGGFNTGVLLKKIDTVNF